MKRLLLIPFVLFSLAAFGQKVIHLGNATAGITEADISTLVHDSIANMKAGVFNVLDYGADLTGATDVTAIVQAIVGSNRTVYFPTGTYKFDTILRVNNVSNLKITGQPGTVFLNSVDHGGTRPYTILDIEGTNTNIEISNIKFESTSYDADSVVMDGLVVVNTGAANFLMDGLKIHDCEFKCPRINAHGIVMYMVGADTIKNVDFYNNKLDSIGQMAFEIVNRNNSGQTDGIKRFWNFRIHHNLISNTGLMKDYGGSISFSGPCKNINVTSNKFLNGMQQFLEFAGVESSVISNNEFESTRTFCSGIYTAYTTNQNDALTITGNTFDLLDTTTNGGASIPLNLWELVNSSITGNTIRDGMRCFFDSSDYNTIVGNSYYGKDYVGFSFTHSNYNLIEGNKIDNSAENTEFSNIGTVYLGVNCVGNMVINNYLKSPDGNTLVGYGSGSSGNNQIQLLIPPTYADNAAAILGGLGVGSTYRTATGVLMIVYTP